MSFVKQFAAVAIAGAVMIGGASVVGGSINAAYAQKVSESHIAAAKRAIKASRSTNQLDNILPSQANQIKAELIRTRPDAEAQISLIVDEAAISLAARRGDLEDEAAQIFVRNFTEEELIVVAEFYESEAGKKFLELSPLVLREIQRAAQVWTNGIRRDLSQAVRQKLEEAGLR